MSQRQYCCVSADKSLRDSVVTLSTIYDRDMADRLAPNTVTPTNIGYLFITLHVDKPEQRNLTLHFFVACVGC
jgi:hypothetical protein